MTDDVIRAELTTYGFRFGACEVTRIASIGGRVVMGIRTDAGREIQVYVSTLGRSLRVFDMNVDANHANRELK